MEMTVVQFVMAWYRLVALAAGLKSLCGNHGVAADIAGAPVCFVPPLSGLGNSTLSPSAAALGYVLSPLAGLKAPGGLSCHRDSEAGAYVNLLQRRFSWST